jgi:DNA-binding MarR family transcriptional regulator/GNAT superfamily N-acetyltransferase
MQRELLSEVRRFNRTVTARIGALEEGYLGSGRPMGQARLLWEVGTGGLEVRGLRARLGIDSGYASRLLRGLERDGLVTVTPGPDRRTRVVRLTPAGLVERQALDERSDALAAGLLEPLDRGERRELVAAMRHVQRLLVAGELEIADIDPEDPEAQRCLTAYYAELERRDPGRFDPATGSTAEPHEVRPPRGAMLVVRLRGDAVGCGALKHHGAGITDIKRMWVADEVRGLGVGRRLLAALERRARQDGTPLLRLETNRHLVEAIALYESAGYADVEPFNDEPYADRWFAKPLDP